MIGLASPAPDAFGAAAERHQIETALAALLRSGGGDEGSVPACLDALTASDDGAQCRFGPTEISLSLVAHRAPTIRCLAEVTNICRPTCAALTVSRLGKHVIGALEALGGRYDTRRFYDLVEIAYGDHHEARPALRFALALEWESNGEFSLKSYYDLHSDGPRHAPHRLEKAFGLLGMQRHFERARERLGHRFDEGKCHGIATDFGLSGTRGLRIYMPGKSWTFGELRELLSVTGRREQIALLDLMNVAILGRLAPGEPVQNALVSLVCSAGNESEPILKLDVFMPAHKPDDLASYDAAMSLAQDLGIPADACDTALTSLGVPDKFCSTQGVLQYLSVDFLPASKTKLNAYFRVLGHGTEHMKAPVRPRRKPEDLARLDEACRSAVRAIEQQRSTHYNEAAHRMRFPAAAGFTCRQELHVGTVFQRALILDALLDAERTGYRVDRAGLDDDIARLVDLRSPDGVRGWKYFETLPEQPADADDLAQIMQVLLRVNYAGLPELVDPPLAVMERSGFHPDGSFETWILDPTDESPASDLMTRFVRSHWGSGPDPEVVANMLYSMVRYDQIRFGPRIESALRYLASRQCPDGSWAANWYCGPYYSTFACARAFQAIDPANYALFRTMTFLRDTQSSSGGWGSDVPNSGDTAHAVRTACLIGRDPAPDLVAAGREFLLRQQRSDGLWPAADFIRMDTGRASGSPEGPIIVHRSRTITTAACLSALCAARPFTEAE